jgi:predicted dehydrogenase
MTEGSFRPVRWGVLSTARIGVQKVIPAMLKSPGLIEVAAIASRDGTAAQAAAGQLGIATACGSYESLLADPTIEAVYNPLPNHLHVPLTLAAAQAGKHVLCEKPMALRAQELEVLRPYAHRVHLREAFMVRHHPQWSAARDALRAGAIGTLRHAQVTFSYFNDDAANIRNVAAAGGGALYDIGCYAVAAGRWFFGHEPVRVAATLERDPAFGTDRLATGLLDFGPHGQLAFNVCTQALRHQRLHLAGSTGRLEMEWPFNPLPDAATRFFIEDAAGLRQVDVPPADQYQLQAEAFSRAVRQQAPDAADLDEAVAMARVMDALFLSATSGRFETPAA